MIPSRPIRVLVVDDSALMRRTITAALASAPGVEVVGTAGDPYEARDRIRELNPDLLTLDIEMPRMDGITFLRILRERRPLPVIVISTLTAKGSEASLAALEAGAVDALVKPTGTAEFPAFARQLAAKVRTAATARLHSPQPPAAAGGTPPVRCSTSHFDPRQLIVIGSSTGGTEAPSRLLPQLPSPLPGICIVQHIPSQFSRVFAQRLNQRSALRVQEATEGDVLEPGTVLVAPGDWHLTLSWTRERYRAALNQDAPVHHCRPSVDVLFASVARCPGARVLAVVLTGMGSDGARGMLELKQGGAHTIAQDEATCVVFGMPKAAVDLDAARQVLPLDRIPSAIVQWAAAAGASTGRPAATTGANSLDA